MSNLKEEDRDLEDAVPIHLFQNLSKFTLKLLCTLTPWFPNRRLTKIIDKCYRFNRKLIIIQL